MALFRRKQQQQTDQAMLNILIAITAAAERATLQAVRNAHKNASPAVVTSCDIRSLFSTPPTDHYPHVQIGSSSAEVR